MTLLNQRVISMYIKTLIKYLLIFEPTFMHRFINLAKQMPILHKHQLCSSFSNNNKNSVPVQGNAISPRNNFIPHVYAM